MKALVQRIPGLGRLLQALGVNSVPAAGFFGEGWSIGTTLLLYWIETVVVILLVTLRIVLHRRWTRKAGHFAAAYTVTTGSGSARQTRHGKTTFLAGFLGVMIPFTAAHGIFVAAIAFLMLPQQGGEAAKVSFADLRLGAAGMLAFLALGLLFDLVGLRDRSFHWMERLAGRAQGRMLLTHLTIIFGMGAMAWLEAPIGLFLVFAGLKLLGDLGGLFAKDDVALQPEPPRWLRGLDRLGKQKDGKTFTEHYRDSVLADRRKREDNEQVLPVAGAS
jgi:hypothetical protein